ncbi:MAG TPA: hypothetical protein VGE47_13320 [Burkholderiaceae bacterium]
MNTTAKLLLPALLAALCSACVFAPSADEATREVSLSKMGERALATCGAGQVKEVSAKSFSCK